MDLKQYRAKLVGDADERAVSPVIGVILMVAITVILAAVIAAFVLDMGDSMGSGPTNAAVDDEVSNSEEEVELTVNEVGDAEEIVLRGDITYNESGTEQDEFTWEEPQTGDSITLEQYNGTASDTEILASDNGSVNIVAVNGDSESQIGSFEWDWS